MNNKIMKLTGNFGKSQAVIEACQEVENAKRERDSLPYGSEEWYEANEMLKDAQNEHARTIKELSGQ